MQRLSRLLIITLVGCLMLFSGAVAQEENASDMPNETTGLQAAEGVPPEIMQYTADWPLPNRDYENTRATTDVSINKDNVNDLAIAWTFDITATGTFGGASSNPIIMGDTVYFQDLYADTYALNLADGSVKWEKIYNNTTVTGPNGPAVGWGKVFVTSDPFSVAALNASSGEELWSMQLINTTPLAGEIIGEGIDIQPTVYDNLVYTSTVPGRGDVFYRGGAVGYIYALDQETGEVAWNFSTVDDPVSIWGNPDVNSGGGVWYTPAVDTETGITYWPIANPAPFAGTPEFPNGASRPGPNLYTNTMMALDHATGDIVWFTQVLPHDLFDHDLAIAPILTSANVSGEDQNVVIGAGKMGRVYAFNRDTGAILWIAVVGRHENDQLAALPPGNTTVYPGALGGVETPMAYANGTVYVPYVDLYTNWTPTSSLSLGVEGAPQAEIQPVPEGTGGLVAVEAYSGKILWDQKLDSINVGGATVVNDLVFTATFNGTIYAFDAMTGEEVWSFTAPAGINAWPAVANDTIVWPCGVGEMSQVIALRPGGMGNVTPAPTMNVTPTVMPPAGNETGNVTPTPTMNATPTMTMNVTPTATVNVTPTVTMNVTPTATTNVTPAPTTPGNATTVNISADNLAFDTDTITVPAGAEVTMVFDNQDGGIPHNVAVYNSPARAEEIFVGEIITGPAEITYTFTAPEEPGTYYFQCDVHPSMNGDFIVE
ncbi:PQQ-binding-like beta-propeller repeat protein [Methanoculleus sp. UBA208]|uniref:outer membrane protein assembly factor BamB family protein n=2 Tax=unclassified Methanoculleus TaxID=2619537 RepID=UPI0025E1867A|nr:PQQ-binding-like beta-propeller repeat protein [Methanoculleus sp. UBA208]